MTGAIRGTYADFKLVKTRQVAQIIIEVPLERAKEVIDLLGLPDYGAEQWVAIAPLETEAVESRAKSAYRDKTPGEQAVARAAILCGKAAFQTWMRVRAQPDQAGWLDGQDHETCTVTRLREAIGVVSRAEIATSDTALATYLAIEGQYRDHMRFGDAA